MVAFQEGESLSPLMEQLIGEEVQKVLLAKKILQPPTVSSLEDIIMAEVTTYLHFPLSPLPTREFLKECLTQS